ncbi:hypothetical protein ACJ41O_009846 [Fusarium nematophilum]
MNTRSRTQKNAPNPSASASASGARRATRSTQESVSSAAPASTGRRATRRSQAAQEPMKPSLVNDPIPRRNAPAPAYAVSVASISTTPPKPDDATEYFLEEENPTEDNVEDEEEPPQDGEDGEDSELSEQTPAIDVGLESRRTSQRVLELSVPDLARAADDLMRYITRRDADDEIFRGRLKIKRDAFYSIRNAYTEQDSAVFIDWAPFASLAPSQGQKQADMQVARANVVSAVDQLVDLSDADDTGASSVLDHIHEYFPYLFITRDDMFQNPEETLDLRTWLFIESLAQQTGDVDHYMAIFYFFCDSTDPGFADLFDEGENRSERQKKLSKIFSHGPFKSLGGDNDEDDNERCAQRIFEIMSIFHSKEKSRSISELKARFPLDQILERLNTCFVGMYKVLEPGQGYGSVHLGTEPQPAFGDEGDVGDTQADDFGSESQSIIRAGTSEADLFVGQESIRALNEKNRAASAVPPSNQQHGLPRRNAIPDYREHTNADLLDSGPLPPPSAFQLRGRHANPPSQTSRKRHGSSQDDEEDEDDPFETDTRSVSEARRIERIQLMPPPARPAAKRPRVRELPLGPRLPPTQTSPRAPASSAVPQSSAPDFAALKQATSRIARQARLESGAPSRQRHVWSHHDCEVLIGLVCRRQAAWAEMEKDRGLFEHPRNQQAYRDKARNMKVDFLMADAVLPPGFDLVALGKKEVDRLKSYGKNPYRKERDIENGKAIGTEWREPTEDSDG